jgi:tetratricopeptide (TPR) repeat protein
MLRNNLVVALLLCCSAGPACGASLEKAKTLYQNNLFDDAKRELIEVLYAAESESADKALALYMLGMVNEKQGQAELAAANWKELIERFPQATEAQLARDNLARQEATQQKNTAVQPDKPAVAGPTSSGVEVRQGTAADLSRPLRTEVPSPMVIQDFDSGHQGNGSVRLRQGACDAACCISAAAASRRRQ